MFKVYHKKKGGACKKYEELWITWFCLQYMEIANKNIMNGLFCLTLVVGRGQRLRLVIDEKKIPEKT